MVIKRKEEKERIDRIMIENHETFIKKYIYVFGSMTDGPSKLGTGCSWKGLSSQLKSEVYFR